MFQGKEKHGLPPCFSLPCLQSMGSDGDQIKYVLLGEWNRMTIQSSHTTYRILNANSVLEQVLDFLQIDKGSDS